MNKILQQLYATATITTMASVSPESMIFHEKFSEIFSSLIIQECAKVANENYDSGFCPVGGFIKAHFS